MSTQPQTQADLMRKVARKIFEGVNRRDVDVFDDTHTADCIWHGPDGREIKGREGIKEMVSGYLNAFPDLRMTREHEVAEGNMLSIHWRCVGTHDGALQDIPPTGKRVEIDGYIIARFERGKVAEEFELFDELAMLKQIGVVEI